MPNDVGPSRLQHQRCEDWKNGHLAHDLSLHERSLGSVAARMQTDSAARKFRLLTRGERVALIRQHLR